MMTLETKPTMGVRHTGLTFDERCAATFAPMRTWLEDNCVGDYATMVLIRSMPTDGIGIFGGMTFAQMGLVLSIDFAELEDAVLFRLRWL